MARSSFRLALAEGSTIPSSEERVVSQSILSSFIIATTAQLNCKHCPLEEGIATRFEAIIA